MKVNVLYEYNAILGLAKKFPGMLEVQLSKLFWVLFDNIEAWQCMLISALALGAAMLYFRAKRINHAAEEWKKFQRLKPNTRRY